MASVLLVTASGCTGADDPERTPPESHEAPIAAASPSESPAWSLDDVRVDRVPPEPARATSALPASFPADDAALPDLLADPPGRARLAYHPRETFDDRDGWADERVFFLGTDGTWRSLEMADLALPESAHPGPDTYGAGDLSPDGTRWAAKTNDGIVLLDLSSGVARVVTLPGRFTNYLAWRPDGRRLSVMRYGGSPTYRTWTVDPRSLSSVPAPYRLPLDGYAPDGTVHTYDRAASGSIHVVHRGRTGEARMVPIPHRITRLGAVVGPSRTMFGLRPGVVVVDNHTSAPVARLRAGVGFPRGWLDDDSLFFYDETRGLLVWDVTSGAVGTLTRVRPGTRPDSYWTASVAVDLMR